MLHPPSPRLRRDRKARSFLRREFADEGPGDFGNLAAVVFDFEVRAKLLRDTDARRHGVGRYLVRFPDRFVRLQEGEAVVELDVERILPIEVPRVLDGRV